MVLLTGVCWFDETIAMIISNTKGRLCSKVLVNGLNYHRNYLFLEKKSHHYHLSKLGPTYLIITGQWPDPTFKLPLFRTLPVFYCAMTSWLCLLPVAYRKIRWPVLIHPLVTGTVRWPVLIYLIVTEKWRQWLLRYRQVILFLSNFWFFMQK